jgi:hypothetical protein
VVLIDPATDRGWVKLRARYDDFAAPEDAEVLEARGRRSARQAGRNAGAEACLAWLEDALSSMLRVGERQAVAVDAFSRVHRAQLYGEHMEPVAIDRFSTHLPLYSLRAAAGGLGEEMESAGGRLGARARRHAALTDLFVAHVVGHSMEPRIPDGSLNLFRLHPAGLAPEQDSADPALRRHSMKPRATP